MSTERISEAEAREAYERLAPIVEMGGATVDPRDEELTVQLLQGTITFEEMTATVLREAASTSEQAPGLLARVGRLLHPRDRLVRPADRVPNLDDAVMRNLIAVDLGFEHGLPDQTIVDRLEVAPRSSGCTSS
ncbi:hypothetical protein GS471_21785, partial [Rhodococcus hoagii]|nr:hypothetical protein [Prescottella equi]